MEVNMYLIFTYTIKTLTPPEYQNLVEWNVKYYIMSRMCLKLNVLEIYMPLCSAQWNWVRKYFCCHVLNHIPNSHCLCILTGDIGPHIATLLLKRKPDHESIMTMDLKKDDRSFARFDNDVIDDKFLWDDIYAYTGPPELLSHTSVSTVDPMEAMLVLCDLDRACSKSPSLGRLLSASCDAERVGAGLGLTGFRPVLLGLAYKAAGSSWSMEPWRAPWPVREAVLGCLAFSSGLYIWSGAMGVLAYLALLLFMPLSAGML